MRALGKHKPLASYSASTKLLNSTAAAKIALFVSETQTLWSQFNYNQLYTVIVYSKHELQDCAEHQLLHTEQAV